MTLSPTERARYSRHLLLPEIGAAGQERLKAARVLVVGAGGLGSPASLYLAAAGVGTLAIVDHDQVELSNLQRQLLFDTASVGAGKALSARARLRSLNDEIDVVAHQVELRAANARELLAGHDCIIDGSDRLATRYLVNDACVLLRLPLVSAAIHRFEGQAMTYLPGQGPCYRCLFPESAAGAAPSCAEAGVLGVLPGMLGALQATEAIKVVLGIGAPLVGRLLTYDALAMEWHEFRFRRRSDCAVCGDAPTIRTLADSAASCALDAAPLWPRVDAHELQRRLGAAGAAGQAAPTVVDVREAYEYEAGHLDGSVNIPLGQLARRIGELPAHSPLVFVCRSGRRSQSACELSARAGIQSVVDLEGGLLAWAAAVDPSIKVA
ncbi:MAG: molybdopterin-synthase adenylyltransferase MoeB [Gammaproteobacteria bacterium]|nr:molybdopterin-synthase adenylyltransferase MoeB [Gammaproteobacteria bacterium]MDE2250053.1 molybdopterin-synthase adenylyltransferase MoeB [Gammaproteobacteria bacterium]